MGRTNGGGGSGYPGLGSKRYLDFAGEGALHEFIDGERADELGATGDLGVGVTFTEVRHIYLDLTSSYFSVVQQMGRGERLCKHSRLPEEMRTLTFHLPFPLMTLGWGAPTMDATARTSPGGIGSAAVTIDDFVQRYRMGTRRETIAAPLHVPVHALDALNDLQRARYQFYAGMQLFQDVAMDADYYRMVAGWVPRRVDLTLEPYDRAKVASMVRWCGTDAAPSFL